MSEFSGLVECDSWGRRRYYIPIERRRVELSTASRKPNGILSPTWSMTSSTREQHLFMSFSISSLEKRHFLALWRQCHSNSLRSNPGQDLRVWILGEQEAPPQKQITVSAGCWARSQCKKDFLLSQEQKRKLAAKRSPIQRFIIHNSQVFFSLLRAHDWIGCSLIWGIMNSRKCSLIRC